MNITLNVPTEIFEVLTEMAGVDDVSVERVATAALGEHVSQWMRFKNLARRPVTREQYWAVLDSALDHEPMPGDRLSSTK